MCLVDVLHELSGASFRLLSPSLSCVELHFFQFSMLNLTEHKTFSIRSHNTVMGTVAASFGCLLMLCVMVSLGNGGQFMRQVARLVCGIWIPAQNEFIQPGL